MPSKKCAAVRSHPAHAHDDPRRQRLQVLLLAFTMALAACGGGAGSDAEAGPDAPASGSTTITWTKPSTNTDGTPLTDISGYRVVYGTSATALTQSVNVAGASATSAVLTGLSPGTYFVSVLTVNSTEVASSGSAVAEFSVQ